jgi:hypothetical protein
MYKGVRKVVEKGMKKGRKGGTKIASMLGIHGR